MSIESGAIVMRNGRYGYQARIVRGDTPLNRNLRHKVTIPSGERWERRRGRMKRPERVAAVEKIEGQRKPDDFFGHRNRGK